MLRPYQKRPQAQTHLHPATLSRIYPGGRTIALTEEDFRKRGFRTRELVAVLAGPSRLIAGRVASLPSAALRAGSIGLISTSARSLGCEDGARVRVRPLRDTGVATVAAQLVVLELEPGPGRLRDPRAYLKGLSTSRRALLNRAARYGVTGCHTRHGDLLPASFEGFPHCLRVAKLLPSSRERANQIDSDGYRGEEREADAVAALGAPLAALSLGGDDDALTPAPTRAAVGSPKARARSSPQEDSSLAARHRAPAVEANPSTGSTSNGGTPGHEAAAPGSARDGTPASSSSSKPSTRVRLETFYREHNPGKLDEVPGILAKYAGREGDLFAKLERKYGPGSLRAVASGGDDGGGQGARDPRLVQAESPVPPKALVYRDANSEARAGTPATPMTPATPGTPGTPTPSKVCRGRAGVPATPASAEPAGARDWGSNERLWFIAPDTPIELRAAEARPEEAPHGQSANRSRGTDSAAEETSDDWSSVGGLSAQVRQLKEAIQLPLNSPEVLRRYGVRPPRGVLLHGPPGTGKTTLARAAAAACGCHVIVVKGPELMSRWARDAGVG